VQHDAEPGGGERNGEDRERRTPQMYDGGAERDGAEHVVIVERDDDPERTAQPGLQSGLARKLNVRELERAVAQIHRVADR